MSRNFYTTGLNNVGSYQVAGTPYLTASNIANQEKTFLFPYVSKSITIENTGSNPIYFRFSQDALGHFKLPSAKKVEIDAKCSAIFVSASAGTGIQLYASLTNIERIKILPEATLFSTASGGGGLPLPAGVPMDDPDEDGVPTPQEGEMGTDSEEFDTDGDGSGDGVDGDPTGTAEEAGSGGGGGSGGGEGGEGGEGGSNNSPVLDLLSLGNIELGTHTDDVVSALSGAIVSATDTEDGTITDDILITHDYVSGSAVHGTVVTATYRVTDSNGNTTTEVRTTTVQDTVDPVITGHGTDIDIFVGDSLTDSDYLSGITATDIAEPVTLSVTGFSPSENTASPNTYAVQITATDASGRTTVVSRNVNVSNAGRPRIYPNRVTPAGGVNIYPGLAASFTAYLVHHANGGTKPALRQGNSITTLASDTTTPGGINSAVNNTAYHTASNGVNQPRLELGGTLYGNAATASVELFSSSVGPFVSKVLELDGTGDYIEYPEIEFTESQFGGNYRRDWNNAFRAGAQKFDLNAANPYAANNPNKGHRYHETIGWFKLDSIPSSGIRMIMDKRNDQLTNDSRGYEIFLQFQMDGTENQMRIGYLNDADEDDGVGDEIVYNEDVTNGYKPVSTNVWYMFRVTTKTQKDFISGGIRRRVQLWAQNETGSLMLRPKFDSGGSDLGFHGFSGRSSPATPDGRPEAPLRIGANRAGGQAFPGQLYRVYRWYALDGATFTEGTSGTGDSEDGGIHDYVLAANMNLDAGVNIQATNTDEFGDPGAFATGGGTATSNWATVMGSTTGPYGGTTPNLTTIGVNKYYLVEYSASNGEGTGYGYRVVRIQG